MLLLSPASAASAPNSRLLLLRVFSDGYVNIAQTFTVDSKASSIQVPLLSNMISDLVATDQNGSPLSYGFSQGSSNLTVYTLGATEVNLHYDTDSLTGKNGTVWTLAFSAGYNSTVVLPQYSTLESVSGTPYSINQTDNQPEMTLSPGDWTVRYGVPIQATTTTTASTVGGFSSSSTTAGSSVTGSTGTAPTGGGNGSGMQEALELVLLAAAIVGVCVYYWWWRGRNLGRIGGDLRPDDLQVLNFIRDKGGKVLEPEIRMKFALPKTSAWRQIKRLERLGYVKVTKIGSQNQIELLKDRSVDG
jgi:uncharacterized membrane protein